MSRPRYKKIAVEIENSKYRGRDLINRARDIEFHRFFEKLIFWIRNRGGDLSGRGRDAK